MSGLAGIIHFDGEPVALGLVENMTSAMAYRGPDGIHHWSRGSVALGHCMLRTTQESLEESQPLTNEDESVVLVVDGRVDNWMELRRELLGHGAILRDRSDAELVLRAYERWGRECLGHIDGDFALVIWDARRQDAVCARDRMGNKPFYYHWNGRTLVFASDLHPILALPWVPQVPNEGMLAEVLTWQWYSRDETLWSGVLRLLAAHCMVVGIRGPRIEQYWEPDLWATLPYQKDEEYIEHYRELFIDSVRRMSRSHRPVAIQVSGGLDSSAVFCVAEHLRREDHLPAPGIEGYTLAFTDDSAANELGYARAVGEYLGIRIREIPPSIPSLSWYAERSRVLREFPGFPNASMFLGLYREASLQGSRVALTGEGGDQWLQGSRSYYAEELAQARWLTLYDCLRVDAKVFGARQAMRWFLRRGVFQVLPAAFQDVTRWLLRVIGVRTMHVPYWLSPKMREVIALRCERSVLHSSRVRSHGQRELLKTLYGAFLAAIMERVERGCAEAGVEIRHPFYDYRIVQHAFSTPERLRLRGDRSKYVHVQAMQEILPPAILKRKSKAEFSAVFRVQLDRMQEVFSATIPRHRTDWVSPHGMSQLFQAYQDEPQRGRWAWILWSIYGCDRVFAPP